MGAVGISAAAVEISLVVPLKFQTFILINTFSVIWIKE
jgi:hypothetical protein